MIYDPKSGALYADDGKFLKSVDCPLALRPDDLALVSEDSPDRRCLECKKIVKCADDWSEFEIDAELELEPSLCIFATPAAKHIVFLQPAGMVLSNDQDLPVIRTARSVHAMQDGYRNGYRVLIKEAGPSSTLGSKYRLFQHRLTGEVWCTGDFRLGEPDHSPREEWELVADWFSHRSDWPFPYAAYLIPRDLRVGQRVFLSDIIEDVPVEYWNQGDSHRLESGVAVWTGKDFVVEKFEAPSPMVG